MDSESHKYTDDSLPDQLHVLLLEVVQMSSPGPFSIAKDEKKHNKIKSQLNVIFKLLFCPYVTVGHALECFLKLNVMHLMPTLLYIYSLF